MSRRRTVAMVVNDNAGCLIARGVWTTIASDRASTGCSYRKRFQLADQKI